MRKYHLYCIPLIISILYTIPSYADTNEEQSCFDILKEYVQNDPRFGGEDISHAYINKDKGQQDLSEYGTGFKNNRDWDKFFLARRNNIGTIITESDYIISQFVTFWKSSNFVFPLPTEWKSLGENYGNFRDQVIYTHHLLAPGTPDNGAFISCAFFRIVPDAKKSLNDVDPSNYKTNDIDASGFSLLIGPNAPIEKNGHRFIVGKVNVPVKNYDDEHQMTLEMITIAHDTQSALFNEFETFPLQVKAMTDMDARDDINTVQLRFLKYVKEQTCLKIPHTGYSDLPGFCGGDYKSLTKDKVAALVPTHNSSLLSYIGELIIPTALARMEPLTSEQLEEHGFTGTTLPQGMYINSDFRFDLREKLDKIGNPVLTSYVLQAVVPGWEKILQAKQKKWEVLTADENTFMNCGIDYKTRTQVISDWLDTVDPKTFDVTNITYSNPQVGDCILPFPDARNRMKIIPGSFALNQYNAARLSNNTGELARLNSELKIDTRNIKPSMLGGMNYYNPMHNKTSRLVFWILLLITWFATIVGIIRSRKK